MFGLENLRGVTGMKIDEVGGGDWVIGGHESASGPFSIGPTLLITACTMTVSPARSPMRIRVRLRLPKTTRLRSCALRISPFGPN